MNSHTASKDSIFHRQMLTLETLALTEEKLLSSVDSKDRKADFDSRFATMQQITSPMLYSRTYSKAFRISSWISAISRTAILLTPSFIHNLVFRDAVPNNKLGPTAYLDGMRGLASLFVFFCHLSYTSFKVAEGWGYDGHHEIWKLPFVRLLFSGPSMVCVFFVISGYALSLKPMKQIHTRSFEGLANTMISCIFRRGLRLFIPPMISIFMVVVLLRLGVYEWTRSFAGDKTYLKNVIEWHPQRMSTTVEQLEHWRQEMFNFFHVWGWEKFGGSTGYDVHLWTIPVEYRCSMMLFLIILGTARLRTGIRFLCFGGLMWFVLRSGRWEMVLFLSGMILAELDVMRGAHIPSSIAPNTSVLPLDKISDPKQETPKPRLLFFLTILALYLMSCPDGAFDQVLGWKTLALFVPEWFTDRYRFWQMVGSILFVACVARSPWWQGLFNTNIVQYFGRISYAIYLVHGPVLHTAGYAIERWAWGITGIDGFAYNAGFMLAALLNISLVIWAADVFWRAVDAPTVRFAKWLETKWCILD